MRVNWKKFQGSSHCEEGLGLFAAGRFKSYRAFEQYFLPHMKDMAAIVEQMKNSKTPVKNMRKNAAKAYKRITYGGSAHEDYGCSC